MRNSRSRQLLTLLVASTGLSCASVHASNYVNLAVTSYTVSMDNDRVYINHPSIVSPCLNQRVEIQSAAPFSADYAKRITALVFGAYLSGRSLVLTYDTTTATSANGYACLLNSVAVGA